MPSPMPKETMSFFDAVKLMRLGKRVAKQSWKNNDYCLMVGDKLGIHQGDKDHEWIVSEGDMSGDDWVVVSSN